MNLWKPLALISTTALVGSIGYQTAFASSQGKEPVGVEGDYHRMHEALENLRAARAHLQNSEHNHGGWRERALDSTDRAIHETDAALHWNP